MQIDVYRRENEILRSSLYSYRIGEPVGRRGETDRKEMKLKGSDMPRVCQVDCV